MRLSRQVRQPAFRAPYCVGPAYMTGLPACYWWRVFVYRILLGWLSGYTPLWAALREGNREPPTWLFTFNHLDTFPLCIPTSPDSEKVTTHSKCPYIALTRLIYINYIFRGEVLLINFLKD